MTFRGVQLEAEETKDPVVTCSGCKARMRYRSPDDSACFARRRLAPHSNFCVWCDVPRRCSHGCPQCKTARA